MESFGLMKKITAKIMKFGREIFFSREPYSDPGTLAGLPGDLPDTFHEIFLINFRAKFQNDEKNFAPK